jgi:hypothetical protein
MLFMVERTCLTGQLAGSERVNSPKGQRLSAVKFQDTGETEKCKLKDCFEVIIKWFFRVECTMDREYFQIFCLSVVFNYPCYFLPPLLQIIESLLYLNLIIYDFFPLTSGCTCVLL